MLVSLVFLSSPAPISFSTVAFGVASNSTAFSSQRKLVRDSRGDLFVIYLKPVGHFTQVFLAESTDNGTTWREVGRVSQGDFESVRASVAIDAKDSIYIFWTKFLGEYGQLFYRIYDEGKWSDEVQLTTQAVYSGYPSACVDSRGHVHLVWYGFDGTAYQVYYLMFDGNHWSNPLKLSQGYPDSLNPTVAVDGADNVHVAWFKSNGRHYQINYMRWTGTWSDQFVLSSPQYDAYNPSLAVDSHGRVVIVWDEGPGQATQIYYSLFDGSYWSHERSITTGPSAQDPSVAIDAQDTVYVLYDKSDGQIYMRTYIEDWSPEQKLSVSGVNAYPSLRWSFLNNPSNSARGKIDFVWTSTEGQNSSVQFGSLNIAPQGTASQTGTPPETLVSINLISAIAAIILFLFLVVPRLNRMRRLPKAN